MLHVRKRQEGSMKTFALLTFIFSVAISVSGQATAPPTEDAGLKIMRVGLQRTVVKGPAVKAVAPTDPSYQKNARTDRMQDSNADSAPALHRVSQNGEVAPKNVQVDANGNPRASRSDITSSVPAGSSIVYVASVVVKNIGTKTVTAVQWEYLLFETNGVEPVKRYRIMSKRVIPPGEQAELTKEITPKGQEQQVRLLRIEYSDHSVWEQPEKSADAARP